MRFRPIFPFRTPARLSRDISNQLCRFSRFLQTGRGKLLAAFVVGAQGDREVAAALRDYWIAPLRKRGTAVLDGYRKRGELPDGIDLDLVQDMMYAPLYYNLLTGYSSITEEYAEMLTETLLKGLQQRRKQNKANFEKVARRIIKKNRAVDLAPATKKEADKLLRSDRSSEATGSERPTHE